MLRTEDPRFWTHKDIRMFLMIWLRFMRYFFKMMIPSVADAAHVTGKTTTKSILLMIEGKRL